VSGFSLEDVNIDAGSVSNLSTATELDNGSYQYTFDYTTPSEEQESLSIAIRMAVIPILQVMWAQQVTPSTSVWIMRRVW